MKKRKDQSNPTASELEILQILWKRGPSTVREIHDELAEKKEVVYTTTLKTMQVMYEKGMLERVAKGRKHIYRAMVKEDETQEALLDQFLEKTFGGSALKLVMKAIGHRKTSQEELNQLKDYIDSLEKMKDDE